MLVLFYENYILYLKVSDWIPLLSVNEAREL